MGSDLIYYLLTTIRGKLTLGEEYCSIEPYSLVSNTFPSRTRRVIFILLKIAGPYLVIKLMKRLEQPLSQYVVEKSHELQENPRATLADLVKAHLLGLLPDI